MRRLFAFLLILHAFAHVSAGLLSETREPLWLVTLLLTLAFSLYVATGLAVLRYPLLRRKWHTLLWTATTCSLTWMALTWPAWMPIGLALDVVLLIIASRYLGARIDRDIALAESHESIWHHPHLVQFGRVLGFGTLVYCATVMSLTPLFTCWGSTAIERTSSLPGDEVLPRNARFRIDHAITIRAPAQAVWPWLAQLGQDRAGFYSYDWLERLFRDDIRNANTIHAEWQERQVGDTVLATQRNYLGGRFGTLGWRITAFERNRVVGLENWGTFVLQPVDSHTTRLIVRTRGDGTPSVLAFVLSPVSVFLFEPAHFIMERGMLRGIRDRAEQSAPSASL